MTVTRGVDVAKARNAIAIAYGTGEERYFGEISGTAERMRRVVLVMLASPVPAMPRS